MTPAGHDVVPDAGDPSSQVPPEMAVRLLQGQRELLAQVVVDAPLDEVLHGLVLLMERLDGGGLTAAALLVEGDPGEPPRLRLAAAPNLPAGVRELIDQTPIESGATPCSTAAARRLPVAVPDVALDPTWSHLAPVCDEAGLRSWWSVPLMSGSELLGCLSVHFPDVREATPEQLDRLVGAGRIASIAVERHSAKQAREQAAIGSLRLDLAQDAARVGLWDWDLVTGALLVDTHCAGLFGTTLEQFEAEIAGLDRRTHPDDLPLVHALIEAAIAGVTPFEAQYRVVWPDGTVRHLLSRGRPVVDGGLVTSMIGVVVDVTELHEAVESERAGTRRLAGLAEVALLLAAAESVRDLTTAVIESGLLVLGADGGAVCVRDDDRRVVRFSLSSSLSPGTVIDDAELPQDSPLPAVASAMDAQVVLLADRAACLAFSPEMAGVLETTGRPRWATLPLRPGGRLVGSLAVCWAQERPFTDREIDLLLAFAAQCAQALDRVQTLEAERRSAAAARRLSEALQRSLLTTPPLLPGLTVGVRYVPASQEAQVGGDWYDAFVTKVGVTSVVIGDVTGHDRDAAALMGQVRNLLRATGHIVGAPPAAVLSSLEDTMAGLGVDVLATCLLAQLAPGDDRRGDWLLHWCSAGHLPPVVHRPDRGAEVLDQHADLMLGVSLDVPRRDTVASLPRGSTVLLYTDGLVERRREDLDVGLERLRQALDDVSHLGVEDMLDALLRHQTAGPAAEDDIALLAVRID